jgi:ADP-heptose:LPS heptosyltransferase
MVYSAKRIGDKWIEGEVWRRGRVVWIKGMLRLFGPLSEEDRFEGPIRSIVIIAQEKIGDAILLTPLIGNLRRALPLTEIHVVSTGPNSHFFKRDPNVDVVYKLKPGYLPCFKRVRERVFDLLFSPKDHPSFTSLFLSRTIRARYRVGMDHPYHRGFFNHLIKAEFLSHVVDKNCMLLDFLGIPYSEQQRRPYMPRDEVSKEVRSFAYEIDGKEPIALNLSAGDRKREWPLDKWIDLTAGLGGPVLVFATRDRIHDKRMLEEMFGQVVTSPVTRSIYEAGEIVRRLGLLISPDTALIHVASCYRVPVVGLYQADPNQVRRFYPYGIPSRCLLSKTDLVRDISVTDVLEAVRDMMDGGGQRDDIGAAPVGGGVGSR